MGKGQGSGAPMKPLKDLYTLKISAVFYVCSLLMRSELNG